MRTTFLALALAAATTAAAQSANPPGNTLAPATGSVATMPAPPAVAPAPDKATVKLAAAKARTEMMCKTTLETGSLIAKRKTCLTRNQWEYVDDAHREEARKLMMDNMGHPPQ